MMDAIIHGPDGQTKIAYLVDYGDGTGLRINYNPDGTEANREDLTGLPVYVQAPFSEFEAGWALLACLSVVTVQDASNIIHRTEEEIVTEVLAWEVAGS